MRLVVREFLFDPKEGVDVAFSGFLGVLAIISVLLMMAESVDHISRDYNTYFRVAESIVTGIFTIEWCLGNGPFNYFVYVGVYSIKQTVSTVVYSTDGDFHHLCSWRTIVDGLSISPFYIKIVIMVLFTARGRQDIALSLSTKMDQSIFNETFSYLRVSSGSILLLRMFNKTFKYSHFKTLRILRLFRLSRYMSSIRLIGRTLQVCKHDFGFLIFLFVLVRIKLFLLLTCWPFC